MLNAELNRNKEFGTMASTSSHESVAVVSARCLSSSSTCSKMEQLSCSTGITGAGVGMLPAQATTGGNIHCSIGQQSGSGGGLAPIMEIREMNNYCNSCVTVGPDKYWNPHPHTNVSRHATVYPQMFYTPPPPTLAPPPTHSANYSTTNTSGVAQAPPASTDWSCPPPSTADSYSHFIYSQYPPPPPSQHDYTNFLSMSTSCFTESDMMMMSTVQGGSSQVQTNCEPSAPVQAMMNSFMYTAPLPPPPQTTQQPSFESPIIPTVPATQSSAQTQRKLEIASKSEIGAPPPSALSSSSASTATSADSSEESDDEDDEESRHISIEDEENDNFVEADEEIVMSPCSDVSISSSSLLCVLCKKPASLLPVLPPNAPSPQLSRILDNIDDDELDISVCSGDIEIGGIEDEMIQQATEQQQQRISLQRLSQLVGITVTELISHDDGYDNRENAGDQIAMLCSKCQKLVGMAESLEKQLTSVLSTLRQTLSLEDDLMARREIKLLPAHVNSIALQTDDYEVDHGKNFIQVRRYSGNNDNIDISNQQPQLDTYLQPSLPVPSTVPKTDDNPQTNFSSFYLCHKCGRHFSCRRNLGKHLKRHHDILTEDPGNKPTCPRENCGKICRDKASLQVHLRRHTSEKPYYCIYCLKLFTTKSNLTAHIKSNACQSKTDSVTSADTSSPQTTTESNTTLSCENCGLTFRSEARFQKHISNQTACTKSKMLQCHVCSKPFAKRSELQAHQVVHTGTKSFLCDICGMAFTTRGNQRVHQRTHYNQKRFKCHVCDKGFTRNQTLQIHIANAHK